MKKNHKRISAAVLSLALGFSIAGAPILAPVAGAQATITAGQASTVNLGEENVSLTINKYEGLPADPEDLATMPRLDAEFTISKVALTNNLDTLAGWQEVAALTPATAVADADFTPIVVSTGTDGTETVNSTTHPTLRVGVYLVTETPKPGYRTAAPFLVTLPFSDSATNNWNYSQTVHPKNQADIAIVKDVVDAGDTIGDTIDYTITAPLPAGNLTTLSIVDDLPVELSPARNVSIYTKTSPTGPLTPLALQDTVPALDGGDGNELSVEFGPLDRAALQALSLANSDLELVVKFAAEIISLPGTSAPATGNIVNHASITVNGDLRYSTDPNDPNGPGPDAPGTGAETRLGDLFINKRDGANAPITGTSATFQLWRCQIDENGNYAVIGEALRAATDTLDPPTIADSFTTDPATGTATLHGVQSLDLVNGAAPTSEMGEDLCVVQTQAPTGFTLNPSPTPVSFTPAADDNFNMVVDVVNLADDDVINLPETGGNGTMALIGAGVLVAAAGGAAAVRGNRARNK